VEPESQDPGNISEAHAEEITSRVMRRQLALSLRVASIFIVLLFGLPLVNQYAPQVANLPVFGFTLTWLVLGVLVFPVAVLLSYYFVQNSDRIEAEVHEEIAHDPIFQSVRQGGGQ
jgi:uncharacterized membrane protein (DUF485 family)